MDNGAAVPREGTTMAQNKKRLGKKHRQASTRPKKGRAPRVAPTTGAVDPRKRKILSSQRAAKDKAARTPKQSPDQERKRTISHDEPGPKKPVASERDRSTRTADGIVGRQTPRWENVAGREQIDEQDWRE